MDKQKIYQHFRKDEQQVIDALYELQRTSELEYRPVLSNFLTPREQYIATFLKSDILKKFFGGSEKVERSRCLFYPNYYEPSLEDFDLMLIEIKYPLKFAKLSHGQILGSILGSGIKRDVLGDIVTDGIRWQFIVSKKIGGFLKNQIDKIGKVKVELKEISFSDILVPQIIWNVEQLSLENLRVDALISHAYHISRQHVKELIVSQKVQVNWAVIENKDRIVSLADVVSVRGYGRIRLDKILGKSKKDKLRIEISVLKK